MFWGRAYFLIWAFLCVSGKAVDTEQMPNFPDLYALSIADDPPENCLHPSPETPEDLKDNRSVSLCFSELDAGSVPRGVAWRSMSLRVLEKNLTIVTQVRRLPLFAAGASFQMAGEVSESIFNFIRDRFPQLLVSYFNGFGNASGWLNGTVIFTGWLNASMFEGQVLYQNHTLTHTLHCPHENTLGPDFYRTDTCITCQASTSASKHNPTTRLGWRTPNKRVCKEDSVEAADPGITNRPRVPPPPPSKTSENDEETPKGSSSFEGDDVGPTERPEKAETDSKAGGANLNGDSRAGRVGSTKMSIAAKTENISDTDANREESEADDAFFTSSVFRTIEKDDISYKGKRGKDGYGRPSNFMNATEDKPDNTGNDSRSNDTDGNSNNNDTKTNETTNTPRSNDTKDDDVNNNNNNEQGNTDYGTGTRSARSAPTSRDLFESPEARGKSPGGGSETISCSLHLVADHLFFSEMGDRSPAKTVNLMLSVVIGADAVFRATDFDGDGDRDNVGFVVKNITIIRKKSAASYRYSRTNGNAFHYLKSFSTVDFGDVCLGVAFTAIDFERGVVGLAWYGSSMNGGAGKGGICGQRVYLANEGDSFSFNTAIVTFINHGNPVSLEKAVLTMAHEFGHCFGSSHDDTTGSSCNRDYAQGAYLMQRYRPSQFFPNNYRFSPCSIRQMFPVLVRKGGCLTRYTGPTCGNGIIEEGEECDCGKTSECNSKDPCCTPGDAPPYNPDPPCTVRRAAGMQCSPFTFSCCSVSCRHVSAIDNYVCREASDCYSRAMCSGDGPRCPRSADRPDGTLCHGGVRVCDRGQCQASLCREVGLEDCFCTERSRDQCKLCCRRDLGSACLPARNFNITDDDGRDVFLPEGDACLDYRGVCTSGKQKEEGGGERGRGSKDEDENHVCVTDEGGGPEESLANLLATAAESGWGDTRIRWLSNNWFYFLLIPIIPVLVISAVLRAACVRRARSQHLQRNSPRRLRQLLKAAESRSQDFQREADRASYMCDAIVSNMELRTRQQLGYPPYKPYKWEAGRRAYSARAMVYPPTSGKGQNLERSSRPCFFVNSDVSESESDLARHDEFPRAACVQRRAGNTALPVTGALGGERSRQTSRSVGQLGNMEAADSRTRGDMVQLARYSSPSFERRVRRWLQDEHNFQSEGSSRTSRDRCETVSARQRDRPQHEVQRAGAVKDRTDDRSRPYTASFGSVSLNLRRASAEFSPVGVSGRHLPRAQVSLSADTVTGMKTQQTHASPLISDRPGLDPLTTATSAPSQLWQSLLTSASDSDLSHYTDRLHVSKSSGLQSFTSGMPSYSSGLPSFSSRGQGRASHSRSCQ